jgi:RNA recognition motif-containing protein
MTLYISNLSDNVSKQDLENLFKPFGIIWRVFIPYPSPPSFRRFGFVEMAYEEAQDAMNSLDGTSVDGRIIYVKKARSDGRDSDEIASARANRTYRNPVHDENRRCVNPGDGSSRGLKGSVRRKGFGG